MEMRHLIIILISLLIYSCNRQNNRVDVFVKVFDVEGNGLPGSLLNFKGKDTTFFAKTDFEGNLALKGLKMGTYQVDVSYVGHYPLKGYSVLIDREQLSFELKSGLDLDSIDIRWQGGWVTFEDENGKVKSVRMKDK